MGCEVLFQVSWSGGTPSEVVPIAERHYNELTKQFYLIEFESRNTNLKERTKSLLLRQQPSREAIQFLKDIYCCRNYFEGSEGIVLVLGYFRKSLTRR